MKAFRYNTKTRNDRKFNNCGSEKNPNAVNFYASNLNYVQNYRFVYFPDGGVNYECDLQTIEIENNNLFDMSLNFSTLSTFKNYINSQISEQLKDFTNFMNNAKNASDRKMWAQSIEGLKNKEAELTSNLVSNEFQTLSDFENQNELVSELTSLGFSGYTTKNEIAIF